MAGLSVHPRLASRPLPLLVLVVLLAPTSVGAANPDLGTAVSAASSLLRQAWAADPSTASLPFPTVRLLPAGASVAATCDRQTAPRQPAATAAWCASSGEVLLDRDLLAEATAKLSGPALQPVLTYWIATALAERLLALPATGAPNSAANSPATSPAPKLLDTLQANCFGGVLLGASAARPSAAANPLLEAARAAYGGRYSAAVGTASQRGYALLTGLGATATASCSRDAMAALARGTVPDPALLRRIEQLPPPERAHSSLMAAISSQCQPLPSRPCPRTTASARSPQ
ncbi:MAG: hypothetical protein ACK5N0_16180 [Synechococcaceae cyanobacterium]